MSVSTRPVIPAERYAAAPRARRGRDRRRTGSMPCSSASGPDLRYLTGYQAMPLERLTMLVLSSQWRGDRRARASSAVPPRPAWPGPWRS